MLQYNSITKGVQEALSKFGKIDILVNSESADPHMAYCSIAPVDCLLVSFVVICYCRCSRKFLVSC